MRDNSSEIGGIEQEKEVSILRTKFLEPFFQDRFQYNGENIEVNLGPNLKQGYDVGVNER